MKIAIAKKIGMTQIENEGKFVGVSVVKILPLVITQIKSEDKDGYSALQVGVLDSKRKEKLNKAQIGHVKKVKERPNNFREFRIINDDLERKKIGDKLEFEGFNQGDKVTIAGMSIGRGFQGMIKRHHARRGPKSHGSDHHRAPGSIGMCSFPARVFKGKKLPGRHGVKKVTIKNVRIIKIDRENKLAMLKGSVPGKKESYIGIKLVKKAEIENKNEN